MSDNIVELQATAHLRLNVGCGKFPLTFWTNLDADPGIGAEMTAEVPPIPCTDNFLLEIYAGHCLEHMEFPQAIEFLEECYRCLLEGGRLGIVVPDTREILMRCRSSGWSCRMTG